MEKREDTEEQKLKQETLEEFESTHGGGDMYYENKPKTKKMKAIKKAKKRSKIKNRRK